jgi:murein L,D-transpeptidase YafK
MRRSLAIVLIVAALTSGLWLALQRRDPVKPPLKPAVALAGRLAAKGLKAGQPVFIRIIKESSELELWMEPTPGRAWTLAHTYPICRWSGDLGPKLRQGDGQAPEGFYAVTRAALNPNSAYHLSFNLGFPNAYDRAHGRAGSFLMVHGDCRSVGCYAMTDPYIEEIYALVAAALASGQDQVPVHIFPFRMTDAALRPPSYGRTSWQTLMGDTRRDVRWTAFWANLKTGWELFETSRTPPAVFACGLTYNFGQKPTDRNCVQITGL